MKYIIFLIVMLIVPSIGNSQSAIGYFNNGKKEFDRQNYTEAIDYFSKAIELDPKFTSAYIQRGLSKSAIGDFQAASNDFTESIKLLLSTAEKYSTQSKLMWQRIAQQSQDSRYGTTLENQRKMSNDMQRATDYLTKSNETKQKAGRVYFYRGQVRNSLKEFDLSIDDFYKAIAYDPKYPCSYFELGQAFFGSGDTLKAVEEYDKAIAYDKKYSLAYFNRGMAKISLGQKEDGCIDLKKASKLKLEKADQAIKENCN